ncbi:diphosphate--fructose-6-phosphate 1-phosphotransferase [Parasphaerochaeta coccoides]|uniref:Pyrophosphate--fructose 6-phosphate 1-phosphotransferase n=1 Tax=Parasphaerochaeta coccoides (strain ATCC BAA-1237 / DSM 17374 / SPN1) TaxID=760011 RepID=F4GI00_PARC1|nr:diphosphate--fructose-6-phosphate 1-phosphotransferase [Parasphaerochaeta coccoides]AEC02113.1 pyrophosphate-dependent phosphofructokinase [Parasphaerochaeta coccoides DSM 17374]
MNISPLQKARYEYNPKLPAILRGKLTNLSPVSGEPTCPVADADKIKEFCPHTCFLPAVSFVEGKHEGLTRAMTVGVILSGGQAPGGHNVISGLFDGLKALNKDNRLIGFKGGPSGLISDSFIEITEKFLAPYRNTGGFDIIGSGRTKLETEDQFDKCIATCRSHGVNAVVIIGGDDSNTNAAILAEYFIRKNAGIQVIGCPKTIDGDLKNDNIEISFGFDTATKTYSELIGNLERDANSAKKYWHFIKLMGRSASHIALECALQTQPNVTLISEEIEENKTSLSDVVDYIASAVAKRAANGNNFGIVLIPEGLVEFIPEVKALIGELNDLLAKEGNAYSLLSNDKARQEFIASHLSTTSATAFAFLPDGIRKQLLMDRDPHGNVQVSRIETEKLLIELVTQRLADWKKEGKFSGSFNALNHFFGYEGRCAFPSNFDADYCYSLGTNAALLIACGLTGYLSSITNLSAPADQWKAGGIPVTMMMNMEQRHGEQKPVIRKALVDLKDKPFTYFAQHRDTWAVETAYTYPGAIQYYGPAEVCDRPTMTLLLEQGK